MNFSTALLLLLAYFTIINVFGNVHLQRCNELLEITETHKLEFSCFAFLHCNYSVVKV